MTSLGHNFASELATIRSKDFITWIETLPIVVHYKLHNFITFYIIVVD